MKLGQDAIEAIEKALAHGMTVKVYPTKEGVRVCEISQKTVYKSVDRDGKGVV